MKNILICALTILAFAACAKTESEDQNKTVKQEAKSFFTSMDDLESGIYAAADATESDDNGGGNGENKPWETNSKQKKIVEMLKPCTISHPDGLLFNGDACPMEYLERTYSEDGFEETGKKYHGKTAEFINLVEFADASFHSRSAVDKDSFSVDTKSSFVSERYGDGKYASNILWKPTSVSEKQYKFIMDFATSVNTLKFNLAVTIKTTGTGIEDDEGNVELKIETAACTLNGANVNCQELEGIFGDSTSKFATRKLNQARRLK